MFEKGWKHAQVNCLEETLNALLVLAGYLTQTVAFNWYH